MRCTSGIHRCVITDFVYFFKRPQLNKIILHVNNLQFAVDFNLILLCYAHSYLYCDKFSSLKAMNKVSLLFLVHCSIVLIYTNV